MRNVNLSKAKAAHQLNTVYTYFRIYCKILVNIDLKILVEIHFI